MQDAMPAATQDKAKEVAFFDRFAADDDYDVFLPEAKARIIDGFVRLSGLAPGARVVDMGCGSGAFTGLLAERGYNVVRHRHCPEADRARADEVSRTSSFSPATRRTCRSRRRPSTACC